MSADPIDRRKFFQQSFRHLLRGVADTLDQTAGTVSPTQTDPRRIRPPGALAEPEFLEKCTRCDDCVQACPAQCITHIPHGYQDAGTPVIVPSTRACVLCTDLACSKVCEPGALVPLSTYEDIHIGTANVRRNHCVTYHNEECTICSDVCPTYPKAIELDGLHPRVRGDVCTGCGLCEERCPTNPKAIQVLPPATEPSAQ